MNKFSKIVLLALGALILGSCSKDEPKPRSEEEKVTAYLLNEGNFSKERGSLIGITNKWHVVKSIYKTANGVELPNVSQGFYISGDKIFVVAQNNEKPGTDGVVVAMNKANHKKLWEYRDEKLKDPTQVAVLGSSVYVASDDHIYTFDANNRKAAVEVSGSQGSAARRMVVLGDAIYAVRGSEVIAIKGTSVTKTYKILGSPSSISGIARSKDGHLWISTETPSQIIKLDVTADKQNVHTITESLSDAWGKANAFGAHGDKIYFTGGTSTVYCHDFTANKTEKILDVKSIADYATQYYNSLGVDPATGYLYLAYIKGWGTDYLTNGILVYDPATKKTLMHERNLTSFPAGLFFTSEF